MHLNLDLNVFNYSLNLDFRHKNRKLSDLNNVSIQLDLSIAKNVE